MKRSRSSPWWIAACIAFASCTGDGRTPRKVQPSTVKLLDPGVEPRAPLRYKLQAGSTESLLLETTMTMVMVKDGVRQPEMKGLKVRMPMMIDIKGIDAEANYHVEYRMGTPEVEAGPGTDTSVVEGMRSGYAGLDGDGKVDLAAPNSGNNDISLFFGNGDGTFRDEKRLAVGDGPASLLAEDLDRDGILDLVAANSRSNDVSILYGKGAGMFEDEQRLPTGGIGPLSIAAAVWSAGGSVDLVTSNQWSNNLSILAGY